MGTFLSSLFLFCNNLAVCDKAVVNIYFNFLNKNLLRLNKQHFVSWEMKHKSFCILGIDLNQELVFVAQNICFQRDPGVDEGNRKQQLRDYLEVID